MKQNLSDKLPEIITIPEDARIITSTPEEREQIDISELPPPPPQISIFD